MTVGIKDVAQRAALVNPYLNWDDQVLLISQGDDATRWYYYGYELNAQLAYGFGGFGYEEGANNWVSTFMSLVTPKHDPWNEEFYGFQKEYPYTAECSQDDLVNFLRQKGWQPGKGYQPGEPNFEVIRQWNAASVYQQAIAIMGKRIDG